MRNGPLAKQNVKTRHFIENLQPVTAFSAQLIELQDKYAVHRGRRDGAYEEPLKS